MGKIILAFLIPAFLFSAEVDIANSDIIERTINFAIFVGILWYLVANRIKLALKGRQDKIASELNAVQDKVAQSNLKKETMLKELDKAKDRAKEIIANAVKEADIISKNIEKQCKNDIENIKKSHQELLNFEQKKAKKAVINEILDELLMKENINLSKQDYINILKKKVA